MSERALRWWCAGAAMAVAGFAAYVSLVPFTFTAVPDRTALTELLKTSLELRLRSKGNFAANAVLFMPFGFFAAGALLGGAHRISRWLAAIFLVLPASVGLSVVIEAGQVFVPGRTPSLTDVYAQGIGTIVGLAAWAAFGREARTLFRTYASGQRRALETVLMGYAVIQVFLLLEPFRVSVDLGWLASKYRAGGIVINPLQSPTLNWDMLPAMLADFLLAAPIGVLAVMFGASVKRRTALMALLLGSAFFTAGEVAQMFVRGRTADVVDLAANLLGMSAGVLAAAAVTNRATSPAGVGRTWTPPALPVALGLTALLYVGYNLSPFDFTYSRQMLLDRLDQLSRVPFHGYYQNPEFKALRDALTKISLALPFGMVFQLWFRPERHAYGRMLVGGWLLVTGLFFAAVEVGQVFVRSRFPDNTDVLLAVAAVWLGIAVTRPFGRSPEGMASHAAPSAEPVVTQNPRPGSRVAGLRYRSRD